ncbi:MAG: glycoside hydrolase family 88 protein [Verrucomicrobia bacterium]|nr:glycoside hydrolase family 88 protein [Verrucomicrobiota bacterium]
MAEHVVGNQLDNVEYPTVCCGYGVLRFARATRNRALQERVESAFADYLSSAKAPDRYANGRKLEHRWFGIIPLELGVSRDARYAVVARREADLMEAQPVMDGPLYYVDHMYGVGTLQAKAFLHLGDPRYAARCLSHLLIHCNVLQRPDGLFHHSERGRPAWGRGNGWAAASMTEALLALPKGYPRRGDLAAAWTRLMKALARHQDARGLWRQIVDVPSSWLETSCTAMFVFALATGLREGWLPSEPSQRVTARGWRALADAVDAHGPGRFFGRRRGRISGKWGRARRCGASPWARRGWLRRWR